MPASGLDALPGDFAVNPDFYLYDLDLENRKARFVTMSRDSYSNSPFLDSRLSRAGDRIYSVDLDTLLEMAEPSRTGKPVNYIFHHGACGSTLLARCLDIRGKSLALREPVALHQLAIARRQINNNQTESVNNWRRLLELVVWCMGRTYEENEVVTLKASDWCNNIIPDLVEMREDSKALLVYRDLRSFLLSTLKTQEGRAWMRQCHERALYDMSCMEDVPSIDAVQFSDCEVIAGVWMAEMYSYYKLLEKDTLNIRSLHGDAFMNDPLTSLTRVTEYFGVSLDESHIRDITAGPAFHSDSKRSSVTFDKVAHAEKKKALAEKYAEEINQGLEYMEAATRDNRLPGVLPCSVIKGV